MRLSKVKILLAAEVLCGEEYLDREVACAFGCDLLSDVLAFTPSNVLLLTGLVNNQVLRTAELIEAAGVVFVRGKRPAPEVVDLAKERGIPLLATDYMLYDSCGILYQHGLAGCKKE
ncbi:MAG: DRTGG domain-containing protein [Bacillota bacterium]